MNEPCALMQVLARLPWLRSLNLVACPLAAAPDYIAALHRLVPSLQVSGRGRSDRGGVMLPIVTWNPLTAHQVPT